MFIFKTCLKILEIVMQFRSCTTPACQKTENFLKMSMSTDQTKICDSFYDYVCENFKTNFPLKPNQEKRTMSFQRQLEIDRLVIDVLEGPEKGIEALEKARKYYKSCVNEDNRDLSSLSKALLKVGLDLRPPFDVTQREELDISYPLWNMRHITLSDFLISFGGQQDARTTNKYLPFIKNTPAISTHVHKKDEMTRNALANYIFNTVSSMYQETETRPAVGNEIIRQKIQDVIDFLTKVQETKEMDNLMDDATTYHSLNDLQSKTDEILKGKQIRLNWSYFIENLMGEDMMKYFNNGEEIIINNEAQLMKVIKIISETKPEVFDAALWWVVVQEFTSLAGTKELQKFNMEYQQTLSIYDSTPRSEICASAISVRFSHVVGYILATREDSLLNRDKIINMVRRLGVQLQPLIEGASWLSEESKEKLFQKIRQLKVKASFDDGLIDPAYVNGIYEEMEFDENDYYSNRMRIAEERMYVQRTFLRSHLLPIRQDTMPQNQQTVPYVSLPPANVNPAYFTLNNIIDIPVGFLGFPFYGLGLPALDFGSTASIIAHELTHMIDVKTQRYDASGNTVEDWRTEDESKEYDRRAECFAKSFKEFYTGDISQRPNYANLLREHVADVVGYELALNAYRVLAKRVGTGKKLGKFKFDHLQLFTIGFAMSYCENATPKQLEWEAQHSSHPPARFRIDAVLRQTEDFGEIWSCAPGTKMNPTEKCKLWTD